MMTTDPAEGTRNPVAVAEELEALTPIAEFRGLLIYHFSGNDFPATLYEIGRLREKGFMAIGAGTGVECDLDEYDTGENAYYQLVAWDPDEMEMVAIYRYQPGSRGYGVSGSVRKLRTANLFDFSDSFRNELLPRAIELGRSVANPSAKKHRFGFFAIWKGLGTLLRIYPETRYFFGTVSLHTHMNRDAVRCIISYLQKHYAPPEPMLRPKKEIAYDPGADWSKPTNDKKPGVRGATAPGTPGAEGPVAVTPEGPDAAGRGVPDAVAPGCPDTPEKRIKHLTALMEHYGETVPMILKSYMSLAKGIWFDGAVIDHHFSDACIISLIVPLENIDPEFRSKFMKDQESGDSPSHQ